MHRFLIRSCGFSRIGFFKDGFSLVFRRIDFSMVTGFFGFQRNGWFFRIGSCLVYSKDLVVSLGSDLQTVHQRIRFLMDSDIKDLDLDMDHWICYTKKHQDFELKNSMHIHCFVALALHYRKYTSSDFRQGSYKKHISSNIPYTA